MIHLVPLVSRGLLARGQIVSPFRTIRFFNGFFDQLNPDLLVGNSSSGGSGGVSDSSESDSSESGSGESGGGDGDGSGEPVLLVDMPMLLSISQAAVALRNALSRGQGCPALEPSGGGGDDGDGADGCEIAYEVDGAAAPVRGVGGVLRICVLTGPLGEWRASTINGLRGTVFEEDLECEVEAGGWGARLDAELPRELTGEARVLRRARGVAR